MKKVVITALLVATSAFGWGIPQNLGNPPNSTAGDSECSVSGAGSKVFFVSTRQGIAKIFSTKYVSGSWTTPEVLPSPINQPGSTCPFWDEARNNLYFSSADHGGYGASDLFVSHWNGSSWNTPQNLGPNVNTSANEITCCVVSGNRLYFTRSGSNEIYTAKKISGNWINVQATSIGNGYPTCYHNGCLYFYSTRPGSHGDSDIWKVQGSGTNWGTPQNLGPEINTSAGESSPSWTSDGRAMYFASNRSGGFGRTDLWRACFYNTVTPTSFGRVKAIFR